MIAKLTFASSALVLGTLFAPQMSAAASFSPAAGINASDSSLVQTVQYRRCRCLARHDCYY